MTNLEENEKVAEVLAETIREAARLAATDALAFVDIVEKTGDALVERAEATARELREVVDRLKGRMKVEMKQLAEEIEHRSGELAEESVRYIRHCAESRETILEHHRKLNGAMPPALPARVVEDMENEMRNLAAAAMRPRREEDQ